MPYIPSIARLHSYNLFSASALLVIEDTISSANSMDLNLVIQTHTHVIITNIPQYNSMYV